MPASQNAAVQRPITEQIEELKSKIALLEGDRKAYYESASYTIKKNREKITDLRKGNKELRKELSDKLAADDHVINKAFENKPVERAAMSNKTGQDAVTSMDHKVCDTKKKLNALKNVTNRKQRRLDELKLQLNGMEKEENDAKATDTGESEDGQRLRNLENKLDKAELKCNEAEHIRKTYESIKFNMLKDQENYENTLSATEAEIHRCRAELKELRTMHDSAQLSKEIAQKELHKNEEIVYSERKQREIELQRMKKEADEKKLQHERIEKRIAQRSSLQQEDTVVEKSGTSGEERQQRITTYEEAFRRMKEATGVSDTQEVVLRFQNQGETTERLEQLKRECEKQITRLTEERDQMQTEFEEMKYSGEAKLSSGQRMLEEYQQHYDDESNRRDTASDKLERNSQLLVNIKAGVEHLSDKLQHLKASKGGVPQAKISPTSDEYVLDLLSQSEEKLLKLLDELGGRDLQSTLKQLEEEEFHSNIEGRLPNYNTRVTLPQTHRDPNVYDDEEESGDDDGDMLTRNALKKHSQQLIESKTKRRTTRKNKKKK